MMIPMAVAAGIKEGTITTAYRRWDVPRVKVGGTQMTSAGVVRFDSVEEVSDIDALSDADAQAAGIKDGATLRARLAAPVQGEPAPQRSPRGGKGGDRVFRVTLRYEGADPRLELRDTLPRGKALTQLLADVAKLDAGKQSGPWTRQILEWIGANPGVISTELAELLGRELLPMKADIRRLKALGLTISLRVGYELSPRGKAYLRALARAQS